MKRIYTFLRKRYRAWRLGIPLTTSRQFRLPASLRICGERQSLKLPDEIGVRVAVMEVLIDDCYLLRTVDTPVKTVIDIGANVGVFCLAARDAFVDATIHAYEPNSSLEPYLRNQCEIARAKYFLEAVTIEGGRVSLSIDADSVCTTSTVNSEGDIPAVPFRNVIQKIGGKVDFLKMDCEGAEWDLFDDVEAWSRVNILAMEYHETEKHTAQTLHYDIRLVLESLGFEIMDQVEAESFGVLHAVRRSE